MNALIEFATLTRSHPGPAATVDQVAAWYEAKGQLHERLAATVGPAEAAAELAYAAAAYEHARRLTARPAAAELATVGGWAS
jgi:hypothetical protein